MTATADRTMVPGYRHQPGHHCGSTALRNLLGFHGVEISEEMAFGLGAGACFYYVTLEGRSPSRFTNGRAARLEENFLELTGAELRLETDEDPEQSWGLARDVVDSGRPAILLTDLYHLDHYGKSAHFPGHAVVLAGYDDELAYLSDTAFEELQTTRLEHLARARHEGNPIFPLAGHMIHLPDGAEPGDLLGAAPRAIERAVSEMLEPELEGFQGISAIERLTAEIGEWPSAAEDWAWCARFLYQVIERRGTGGGNFRRMYSRFLEELGREESALAAEAAEGWSALAEAAREASEDDDPGPIRWRRLSERTAAVLEAERRLWDELAAA
jgi:Butirosin biosynthesis protein H, N-terminal/Domain of unknown function (DUF4872)